MLWSARKESRCVLEAGREFHTSDCGISVHENPTFPGGGAQVIFTQQRSSLCLVPADLHITFTERAAFQKVAAPEYSVGAVLLPYLQ